MTPAHLTRCHSIIRKVCAAHHLTFRAIQRRDRHWSVHWPRLIVVGKCFEIMGSKSAVGRLIRRDHGTIYHALNTLRDHLSAYPEAMEEYNRF